MKTLVLLLLVSISMQCSYCQLVMNQITVPLGGNCWVTVKAKNGTEAVTVNGLENWKHTDAVWSTYIKVNKSGTLKINAAINVPQGQSIIKFSIDNNSKTFTVTAGNKAYEIGEWNILKAGYVKIDMRGMSKTGDVFGTISELHIGGSAIDEKTAFVKNNDGNYFYWGRRGPSVHINYDLSKIDGDIEWFYSEITVPVGYDPVGSYFMANGFAEGYFGIQVNSLTERRVLFSVWSPFETDDPTKVPADNKIVLIKKGNHVYTGEFGDEGSGGQSFLKYNWKAGETYKFLIKTHPTENNYTLYTAYFYAAAEKKWLLIASFGRPATNTYLKKLHSFLENFEPETGYITRQAWYHNQWVKTTNGPWQAVSKMRLTADVTAKKGYRMDYDGGAEKEKFYLRNCGFFNKTAALQNTFSHVLPMHYPTVNLSALK
ncbi:MAG: DUF3472 domain-containing protein [Ferruginibacter sp.]